MSWSPLVGINSLFLFFLKIFVLLRYTLIALIGQSNRLKESFLAQKLDNLGILIESGALVGSWFFARKPTWVLMISEPSILLNLKCSLSIAKACTSLTLLAVAMVRRKAVFIDKWSKEASCNGSNGALHIWERTIDKSHLGASDLSTGLWVSKDLISSEIIGCDPISYPDLNFKVFEIVDL